MTYLNYFLIRIIKISFCHLSALILLCTIANSQDPTWLKDITHEAGLDSVIGTRIVLADVNNDNYPDLLWGTGNINRNHYFLYLNVPNPDTTSSVKRIFRDFTKESNINANRDTTKKDRIIDIANLVDVDNDGDLDIITSIYYHRLQMYLDSLDPGDRSEVLLNDGQGHFTLVKDNGLYQYGLINATGLAFLDYDYDGKIDLYISTWFYDYANEVKGPDVMFKGNGDGSFSFIQDNGIQSVVEPMYGVNITDWDNDGWQDILTSAYCRSGGSLFQNQRNGTFVDVAPYVGYTSQLIGGDHGQNLCQWEANAADFDNDGDMDLLQVEVHGGYNEGEGRTHVTINEGAANNYSLKWDLDRVKRDAPIESHLGDQGGCWFDIDGDGWQDIAIGQMGYPAANLDGQERLYICKQNAFHYFDDISKQLGIYNTIKEAHSMEPADYDLDGDQDLFVSHQQRDTILVDTIIDGKPQQVKVFNTYMKILLLRNDIGNINNWLSVKLDAPANCNKSAIGARITVCSDSVKQISEIQTGLGHFASEQPFIRNFGIGKLNRIDSVIVRWPMKGIPTTVVKNPPINEILEIGNSGLAGYVKTWKDKRPIISFDKSCLNFDTLNIGQNKELTFAVKNLGDTTLVISAITLDSTTSKVFSKNGMTTPFSVKPDSSVNFTVKFTPLVKADYRGLIRFTSNAQNAPEKYFDLIGSGFEPQPLILSDSLSLTFPNAWIDTTRERKFTIKNFGELPLSIEDFVFEGTNGPDTTGVFSIDKSNLPLPIDPKATKNLTIFFKPSIIKSYASNLIVKSNAYNGNSLKIMLAGDCDGPAPFINVTSLILFGSVPTNSSKEKTIEIKNQGNADMHITNVYIKDDSTNVFTIVNHDFPVTVKLNDTFKLFVNFTPKEQISYNQNLIINSDAYNDTAKRVSLKGSGGQPLSVGEHITSNQKFIMKIQPNPVDVIAKLIYQLDSDETEFVAIDIYSTTGMRIKEIINSSLNPGEYITEFNSSGMASGLYFIIAKVGKNEYHLPFVVTR